MSPFRTPLLLLSLLLISGLHRAWSQEELLRQKYPSAGDTFVLVESLFGKAARQGSLPYRITIRNNTGADRTWNVELREGNPGRALSTASNYRISVENGSEVQREVAFQFAPSFLAYDYRNLKISVSSPGLPSEVRNEGDQTNQDFPALAMSEPLARRSLARLDDLLKKENSANVSFAKSIEASYLPTDWKGYTGIDAFLIDLPSWQALSLAQRQAIFAWVRLGGRLDVYVETDIPFSGLKLPVDPGEMVGNTVPLSLGEVRLMKWDGKTLPDNLTRQYRSIPSRAETIENDFSSNWSLQETFGTQSFNPTLVFFLLLVFAILVAPVNLFYLAKPGRRHRLFVTTPIISVATCLLVILLILFIDGIGGRGIRTVLADLQPSRDEMRLYLSQEQISRTGVMVNTGFEIDTTYDLNPVRLAASNFNSFSMGSGRDTTFEINGGRYDGGLFRSRSEQAYSIRSVEPTRSRIELTSPAAEGSPPALTSSLAQPIADLMYIDGRGEVWTTPGGSHIAPGGTIPLEKADKNAVPEWLKTSTAQFSLLRQKSIESLRSDRNRFFARLDKGDDLALPTHQGIKWESTTLILTGTPVARIASATSPETPPATAPTGPAGVNPAPSAAPTNE